MARVVINPKSTGTIRFASAEAGLAAAPMFEEQISNFRVQASQNLADIPATYAAPAAQSAAASSWAITFEYLQDWGKTDGLSKFLYDNDGVLMWFQHNPAGSTAGTESAKPGPAAADPAAAPVTTAITEGKAPARASAAAC